MADGVDGIMVELGKVRALWLERQRAMMDALDRRDSQAVQRLGEESVRLAAIIKDLTQQLVKFSQAR